MALQEFSRDVVPIIQLVVTVVALGSLLLLWWQIRQTTLWNKLNSRSNFANVSLLSKLEARLCKSFKTINIDIRKLNRGLTEQEVEKILGNDAAYFATKWFLGDLENLGAAVSIGALDPDLAYAVHSSRLLRGYKLFSTFIDGLRNKFGDHEFFIELEKTALKWERLTLERRQEKQRQIEKLKKEVQELKDQVTHATGAQRKVK